MTGHVGAGDRYLLRLYIAGSSARSMAALRNLRELCETHLVGRFELEVVDLVDDPSAAVEHNILAIPTLIRQLPLPVRQIIGDLSDHERVLEGIAVIPLD